MKKSVIGLIILLILGLSITAILTSISVLAKDGKEHKGHSNEHDNKQNSKEKVEIEAYTINESKSKVKLELKFITQEKDKEGILNVLNEKIKELANSDMISNSLKIKQETTNLEDKLKAEAKVGPEHTLVKFEYVFTVDSTTKDGIVNAIVNKLTSLNLSTSDIELEDENERVEKAKEDAVSKGNNEVVNAIDKAKGLIGRSMLLAIIKMPLKSVSSENLSFGAVHIFVFKNQDADDLVLRTTIHLVITDTSSIDTSDLYACLNNDGNQILLGKMNIVGEGEGVKVANLRTTIHINNIVLPNGISMNIVKGDNCSNDPIFTANL
jgi:hypothetical protein